MTVLSPMQCDIVNALFKLPEFVSPTYIGHRINLPREQSFSVVHDACTDLCRRGILTSARVASPKTLGKKVKAFQLSPEMRVAMQREFNQ